MRLLEMHSRRVYIYCFTQSKAEEAVRLTFPELRQSSDLWVAAVKKVKKLMKNWKFTILKAVATWLNSMFLKWFPDTLDLHTFKEVKAAIEDQFEAHWLDNIFCFAVKSVDFEEASEMGKNWLACKYILTYTVFDVSAAFLCLILVILRYYISYIVLPFSNIPCCI